MTCFSHLTDVLQGVGSDGKVDGSGDNFSFLRLKVKHKNSFSLRYKAKWRAQDFKIHFVPNWCHVDTRVHVPYNEFRLLQD